MARVTDDISRVSKSVEYSDRKLYEYYGAPTPDGVTEKSLAITLPRNALVRRFEVVVTAATAHAVTAGEAGQVRTTPASGGLSVVLDFGTPRTVSAVQAPAGVRITSVSTWVGTEFGRPKYADGTGDGFVELPSEVRTERLQLTLSGSTTTEAVANEMVLVVPESPAGIELRIDGGPPIFSQAGAVDPGSSAALSATAWNENSERVVDLASALSALTGDPLDETSATFTATVTSRVPGTLDLQRRDGGQEVRRIRRATFNGQTTHDVNFESEGRQTLALESLPLDLTVKELRAIVSGPPPVLRVVPPIGPEPAVPPFASIALTPARAACLRVPSEPRFAELIGIRLPLAAGASGAEARVLLWRSRDAIDVSPSEPMPSAASDPVTIDAGPEEWRTFTWKKGIPIPKDFVLWAVLTISRGEVSQTLGDAALNDGGQRLLWGAPSGPWHDLPEALASSTGRIRAIGKPKPDAVFPPLRVQIGAIGVDVVQNAKGTAAALIGTATQAGATTLVLTSHAPATITLRDVDVVSTT